MAQESLRLVSHQIASSDGRLPRQYSAVGQGAKKDMSPPLEWYGVPDGTKSLALVVQDIDAPDPESPVVPWTHWVVANISPDTKGLPEDFSGTGAGHEYGGLQEGVNDWKQPGWQGPVPSSNGHRIQFRLYALDDGLKLGNKVWIRFIRSTLVTLSDIVSSTLLLLLLFLSMLIKFVLHRR
jgi:Raf kinase inhibitor-like YbhB/YbcL family protein